MENLQGKILISTSQIQNNLFKDSLVLICEHSEKGIMGIIINKNSELSQNELISQVKNDEKITNFTKMVLDGGPLKKDQGFVLHSPVNKMWRNSKLIDDNTALTTSRDIIEAIADNQYTGEYLIALGYCGWENKQLEDEIKRNDWLVAPNDPIVILRSENELKKQTILKNIGITNISTLNPNMGTA